MYIQYHPLPQYKSLHCCKLLKLPGNPSQKRWLICCRLVIDKSLSNHPLSVFELACSALNLSIMYVWNGCDIGNTPFSCLLVLLVIFNHWSIQRYCNGTLSTVFVLQREWLRLIHLGKKKHFLFRNYFQSPCLSNWFPHCFWRNLSSPNAVCLCQMDMWNEYCGFRERFIWYARLIFCMAGWERIHRKRDKGECRGNVTATAQFLKSIFGKPASQEEAPWQRVSC